MRTLALLMVALVVLVSPAAAKTGLASEQQAVDVKCGDPPTQQLSASKTKEVKAGVDATVEVVKAGANVSASTTEASNTVLMTPDGVEREWALYSLCLRVESGVITKELYEKVVAQQYGLAPPGTDAGGTVNSPPPAVVAPPTAAAAPAAAGLVTSKALEGTWFVTSTETRSFCPSPGPGAPVTHIWKVSTDSGGGVTVDVSGGGANFTRLQGRLDGLTLRLTGDGADRRSRVVYFLDAQGGGGELRGDELMASGAEQPPCAFAAAVTATRH